MCVTLSEVSEEIEFAWLQLDGGLDSIFMCSSIHELLIKDDETL